MTTKFTKGPWVFADGDNFEKEAVVTTEGRIGSHVIPICEMDVYFDGDVGVEQAANVCLIACAPEMYDLLAKLQIEGGLGIARHREIDRLLAKARGEA
jgi:hypothetical protein